MKKFWNLKKANDEGELILYGDISSSSWFGDEVTPKQFKDDLDSLGDVKKLNIYINSGGGDVFAGQAIYTMLKRHNAKKTVYVDGLAASIASVIAMAGDEIIIPANGMIMIHNPWTVMGGSAADFRKIADQLDLIRDTIAVVYEQKTALTLDEITKMMDEETWMTAEMAVEMGFATKIEKEREIAAHFDLTRYKNAPEIKTHAETAPAPVEVYQNKLKILERKLKRHE